MDDGSARWSALLPDRRLRAPVSDAEDVMTPSVARVYDYALGGKDNYAVDREAAAAIARRLPEARELARDCRDFVRRAVRWLVAEAGVDQIVDIGSGLPTAGNVHEIARDVRPGVRVVYVDNDPTVLTHGRVVLARDPGTEVIAGDVRAPEEIFAHPVTRRLIDPDRPVAVMLSCVLHHLADADDPDAVMAGVRAHIGPGSHLAVANFVWAPNEPRAPWIQEGFLAGGLGSGRFRTVEEQRGYFDGLELVEPGLVFADDWRPDEHSPRDSPVHRLHLAGVARRPRTAPRS